MCASAIINGKLCESIGEFRAAIYPKKPIFCDGYKLPISDYVCLCPVDFEATAAAIGCEIEQDDFDPMRVVFSAAKGADNG